MQSEGAATGPRLIVFEGVDGAGKTTLHRALAEYFRGQYPDLPLYADVFPGSVPGTLGEWVYRFHHGQTTSEGPHLAQVSPAALQLLHVAAHVDLIQRCIAPTLRAGGVVLLDRYWWSTYAYSRMTLPPDKVWPMVNAERAFWRDLPKPVAVYVSRGVSLKAQEIDPEAHARLAAHYHEVIDFEREQGVEVIELENEGSVEETWYRLLDALHQPHQPLAACSGAAHGGR